MKKVITKWYKKRKLKDKESDGMEFGIEISSAEL